MQAISLNANQVRVSAFPPAGYAISKMTVEITLMNSIVLHPSVKPTSSFVTRRKHVFLAIGSVMVTKTVLTILTKLAALPCQNVEAMNSSVRTVRVYI